jgi:hypothetical protein
MGAIGLMASLNFTTIDGRHRGEAANKGTSKPPATNPMERANVRERIADGTRSRE